MAFIDQKEGEATEYDLLFNQDNQANELEREEEYNFFHEWVDIPALLDEADLPQQPENQPLMLRRSSSVQSEVEGMVDELKVIYKKLGIGSCVVAVLCAITLITGIVNGFYTWAGITFNSIVMVGALMGIYCAYYYDFQFQALEKRKLKMLLLYFVICIFFTLVIFGIYLYYLVVLPQRYEDEYPLSVFIGCIVFSIFGLIFWIIFVCFYIDLAARAVLKRGRINFTIIAIKNDAASWRIWLKLYLIVIQFRVKFRRVRRWLTAITGVYCFQGTLKLRPVPQGVEEEEKAIAVLTGEHEEGPRKEMEEVCDCCQCDLKGYVSNLRSSIARCICCPCVIISDICPKISPQAVIGILVFVYVFFPMCLLAAMVLLVLAPYLLLSATRSNTGGFCFVSFIIVLPLFVYLWWFVVCPHTDTFSGTWDWTAQCIMWDYTSLIFVECVLNAFGGTSTKVYVY